MPLRNLRWMLPLAAGLLLRPAAASDKPYEFGVFPYLPLTKIHELHAPIAADFEKKLGRTVRLSSKRGYAAFSAELRRQTYDVALVQPFDYVDAHDKHGYLPLARRGEDLQAVIVVREDSALQALHDLKRRTLASPPADAAVSMLANMALRNAGIDARSGLKRQYERNHFSCMQTVVIGVADACSTAEQALRQLQQEKRITQPLRVLHRTEPIAHSLFIVHKRVSKRDQNVLFDTVVNWPKTEEGRHILERGQFMPFVPAKDSDYEAVRRYLRNAD